jgi:glycosyltransferase involved in cell wall biosynthesis
VIHVHGVHLANSIWAYLAARRQGTPYVIQPHGTLDSYQQSLGRAKRAIFDRLIGPRILAGAAALIATSGSEADRLRRMVPSAHVVTVPLGVTRHQPAITSELREQLTSWLAEPVHRRALFVGRLARKKRPDLLIEAWNHIRDDTEAGHLLIVGSAQDWNAETLNDRLTGKAIGTVTFLPAVPPAAVAWLMTEASIFTLLGESANRGITVAEAMVYGCAVVTTQQTATSEHVTAAKAGVVLEEPDRHLLRDVMGRLLTDPGRVDRLCANSRRYADVELTWSTTALRLNGAYADVVDPA